jgi:hypothetical protein
LKEKIMNMKPTVKVEESKAAKEEKEVKKG